MADIEQMQINPTGFLAAISFLEVAVTFWMTKHFGARAYAWFTISTVVGLVIQWLRWKTIKTLWLQIGAIHEQHNHLVGAAWAEAVASVPGYLRRCREVNAFWISTGLLLFPGFVTDLVAFALMLPFLRRQFLFDAQGLRLPRSKHSRHQ